MTPSRSGPHPAPRTIALVHYASPPIVGGVERVLARHAVLLADAGHDVRVVAGRGGSPDARVRFVNVALADPRHPSIERLQRQLEAGRVPDGFPAIVADIAASLGDAFRGVDVVIAHNVCSLDLNLALTAAIHDVTARAGAPRLIVWHHDLSGLSPVRRSALHQGPPWDLVRSAWPGATQVVVSEERRDQLAELAAIPASSILVVPNGVDVLPASGLDLHGRHLAERIDLAVTTPLLLVPTRLIPRKNVELALRVVAAMRAIGRPAGLVVTGPADPHDRSGREYVGRLLDLRRELGLDEHAVFLSVEVGGPPSDAAMRDLYRLADVLFLPSRDEGFGLPILEAAASRLPIVCTGLPTFRHLAGDAALFIGPDEDPVEVAARTLEFLAADGLGRLARHVRSTYSWDVVYRDRIAPLLVPD